MNRAQIERAEKAAEQLGQQRLMKQFRRMDEHDHYRAMVKRMVDNTDDEIANVEAQLTEYGRQARRFEEYRQEALAFLIAEGKVNPDPGFMASEAPVKRHRRQKLSNLTFTDRQLEIAEQSLDAR